MKITRLRAAGFRAFTAAIDIDLDADVVVLSGPNGQGKTSLLDAILWGLCGSISRFQGSAEQVVSLYSPTGEAEVEVELASGDQRWTVRRAWDGEVERLHLAGAAEPLSGPRAAIELSRLFGHPESSRDSSVLAATSLHTALTRAVYLQQDLVREFLDADDATSRYENLSQLFGTRRVVDLQVELERQKANWSKSLNADGKDVRGADDELRQLDAEIERLEVGERQPFDSIAWLNWWQEVADLAEEDSAGPDISSNEAPVALDRALRALEAKKRSRERRLSVLDELISGASSLGQGALYQHSLDDLVAETKSKEEARTALETHLHDAEEALAESRRQAARGYDEAQDRALFGRLALRHLSETCPICQQEYDRSAAEERLTDLAAVESEGPDLPTTEHVDELRGKLKEAEGELTRARQRLASATDQARERERFSARLTEAGLGELADVAAAEWSGHLLERRASVAESVTELQRLQEAGERLSLGIARAGEAARLEALRKERSDVARRRNERQRELGDREETAGVAQSMIEGLRMASQMIVSRELKRIRPMAQRIYSAMDPHPALRHIDINTTMFRGRGHVSASIRDPETAVGSDHPEQVLSSSQMNALALSIFFALNVCARDLPLQALILDDPLQSLDDINLLGLVDLLRRLSDERQLILSTHNARFSSLLERKLRPVRPQGRTLSIAVDSWTREGPAVHVREVERPHDLFVVA